MVLYANQFINMASSHDKKLCNKIKDEGSVEPEIITRGYAVHSIDVHHGATATTANKKRKSDCNGTSSEEDGGGNVSSSVRSREDCKPCGPGEQKQGATGALLLSTGEYNNSWEKMFAKLLEFRAKHGHCRVPNRYSEDARLGAWVAVQRRHYKLLNTGRRKKTSLTPERRERLSSVGFLWSCEVPWKTHFIQLLEFVAINGHAQVPMKWEKDSKFSTWVSLQRREYKNLQNGRPSILTQDQILLLNCVGFVWQAERGGIKRLREGDHVPVLDKVLANVASPVYKNTAIQMLKILKNEQNNDEIENQASKMPAAVEKKVVASASISAHNTINTLSLQSNDCNQVGLYSNEANRSPTTSSIVDALTVHQESPNENKMSNMIARGGTASMRETTQQLESNLPSVGPTLVASLLQGGGNDQQPVSTTAIVDQLVQQIINELQVNGTLEDVLVSPLLALLQNKMLSTEVDISGSTGSSGLLPQQNNNNNININAEILALLCNLNNLNVGTANTTNHNFQAASAIPSPSPDSLNTSPQGAMQLAATSNSLPSVANTTALAPIPQQATCETLSLGNINLENILSQLIAFCQFSDRSQPH